MHLPLALLGALSALAAAVPSTFPGVAGRSHVVHEKRAQPPRAWAKRDAVPGDMVLPMRIGLAQRNLDRGHDLLMDVAHPESPNYGKHYTAEEVHALFAPDDATVAAVRAWLEGAGIAPERVSQSTNKAWLQFDAEVAEVEPLLRTTYHFYEHQSSDVNVACDEYYVPADIQPLIDYITPGLQLLPTGRGKSPKLQDALRKRGFASAPGTRRRPFNGARLPVDASGASLSRYPQGGCDRVITPACIRTMYKMPNGTTAVRGNELGVYQNMYFYSQPDLDLFFTAVAPNIPNGTHPELRSIDGGLAPLEAWPPDQRANLYLMSEADLDFQVAIPLVFPQGTVDWQYNDYYYTAVSEDPMHEGLFNNFLNAMDGSYCTSSAYGETGNDPTYDEPFPDHHPGGYSGSLQCGVYKPTNVITISYGYEEAEIGVAYQRRQCDEFLKLGLQGVSLLFASGDFGVSLDSSSEGCLGSDGAIFNPIFPVGCPYVTVAGVTMLPTGAVAGRDVEVALNAKLHGSEFRSGGGFSNIYPAPAYQARAVSDYFSRHAPAEVQALPYYNTTLNVSVGAGGGLYNRGGRAYPDISAVGWNLFSYVNQTILASGGSSMSAPLFASMLTLINEQRIAAGKSTVGFVNPMLYAHPEVFNDVTVGDNKYCNGKGFVASTGWDPVTGLGTPNFPALLKMFMAM